MRHTSEQKRLSILKAAADTFAEKGYYDSSIQNITERAGVSTGTFYIYFKNKEEILLALYKQFADNVTDMLSAISKQSFDSPVHKLAVCTLSLIQLYTCREKLYLLLITKTISINKSAQELYYKIFHQMTLIFYDVISQIDTDPIAEEYTVSVAYLQIVNSICAEWLAYPDLKNISELCYVILRYNFNALSIKASDDYIKNLISQFFERNDYI